MEQDNDVKTSSVQETDAEEATPVLPKRPQPREEKEDDNYIRGNDVLPWRVAAMQTEKAFLADVRVTMCEDY